MTKIMLWMLFVLLQTVHALPNPSDCERLLFPSKGQLQKFAELATHGLTIYQRPFARVGDTVWIANHSRIASPKSLGLVKEIKSPLVPGAWDQRGLALIETFAGTVVEAFHYDCNPISLRRTFLSEDFDRSKNEVKVAFLDADDTIRTSKSDPGGFVDSVDDVLILSGVVEKIRELNAGGFLVAIVSNQAGIPKMRSFQEVDDVLLQTIRLLKDAGAIVHYYDFAEHYDRFRKPEPGMAQTLSLRLREHFQRPIAINKQVSFMVGDAAYMKGERRPDGRVGDHRSNSDRVFAENLGLRFFEAAPFFRTKP